MKTLEELAQLVGGQRIGDPGVMIAGVASVANCRADEITFALDPKFIDQVKTRQVGALLVQDEIPDLPVPQIVVSDPKIAAFQIARAFSPPTRHEAGISSSAFVDETATVDATATVMPFAYVGPNATVGAKTVLYPGVSIGQGAGVGADCRIFANAVVGDGCVVGDRVILHPNVSIGADGFGFYPDEQGRHQKIPQLGSVQIGNDVEIGACSCVDRATFGRTVIGDGTKIDNLVQIAHNCLIGQNGLFVSQAGLAGSVDVGDNVTFAARSASAGHVRIGRGAIVGAWSAVLYDVEPGARVGGVPARNHMEWKRSMVATEQLPAALRKLRRLEDRVAFLEAKLEKTKNGEGDDS